MEKGRKDWRMNARLRLEGATSRRARLRLEEATTQQARLLSNTGWTLLRQGYGGQADEALCNTGWTDEARAASLASRQAKARLRAKEREWMFERQIKEGGKDFIENWYPRGKDGATKDPHFGETSAEAPYGYNDVTGQPRTEPLYDRYGRPIIPRPWKDYFKPSKKGGRWVFDQEDPKSPVPWLKRVGGESLDRDLAWLERRNTVEKEWGRFGRKKKWMDQNPNATEADWKAHDAEQFEEWKKQHPLPEKTKKKSAPKKKPEKTVKKTKPPAKPRKNKGEGNMLILNRDTFEMPADGWYQVAPLGEFVHRQAGVLQVVDREACEGMVSRFQADALAANFAGLLVDFDHFSLDGEKRSEAAGWITALEARCQRTGDGGQGTGSREGAKNAKGASEGLWAKIRWSDTGEEAVKGGRYRFLSPVWSRSDCVDLGNGRVRPVRLLNAAVTNDPNLRGMRPLSNRWQMAAGEDSREKAQKAQGEVRLKWVLGESPGGRHCPSCEALAGQVHTRADWEAAGLGPGAGGLYCHENCHCKLVETQEDVTGTLGDVPQRRKEHVMEDGKGKTADKPDSRGVMRNGSGGEARPVAEMSDAEATERAYEVERMLEETEEDGPGEESGEADAEQAVAEVHALAEDMMVREAGGEALSEAEGAFLRRYREIVGNRLRPRAQAPGTTPGQVRGVLANAGWSDRARAAALAVRRAKAGKRGEQKQDAPKQELRVPGKRPLPRRRRPVRPWRGGAAPSAGVDFSR